MPRGCCLFPVFEGVLTEGLKKPLKLKIMEFHTFASFTLCWTIKWSIKTITRTVVQAQGLVLWLKKPHFYTRLWLSCRKGSCTWARALHWSVCFSWKGISVTWSRPACCWWWSPWRQRLLTNPGSRGTEITALEQAAAARGHYAQSNKQ